MPTVQERLQAVKEELNKTVEEAAASKVREELRGEISREEANLANTTAELEQLKADLAALTPAEATEDPVEEVAETPEQETSEEVIG